MISKNQRFKSFPKMPDLTVREVLLVAGVLCGLPSFGEAGSAGTTLLGLYELVVRAA